MKSKILSIILTLIITTSLFATEARVESMGSNSDFLDDDIAVIKNPSAAFRYGNLLVGSLGKMQKSDGQWSRTEQWYGGWSVFSVASNWQVALGAQLNKTFDIIEEYKKLNEQNFFRIHTGPFNIEEDYIDILDFADVGYPYGNVYLFGGASYNKNLSFAMGLKYGENNWKQKNNSKNVSLLAGNFGLTYNLSKDDFVEASVNVNKFKYKRFLQDTLNLSFDENSFQVLLRSFISMTKKISLIPVFSMDLTNIFGINNRDLGFGIGINRNLYKGLIWVGGKYVNHYAEYPGTIGGQKIYPSSADSVSLPTNTIENSHKLLASFGVEKKMLWDWFTIRVGGNKVFEYLEKKDKDTDDIVEKSLEERDVDAVAFGISIGTPDDKLRFDVTVSEEFPYSNILEGGEDGILVSRISAALKF